MDKRNKFQNKTTILTLILILSFAIDSCRKFVEVDPPVTSITGSTVYENNVSAAAVMTGLYSNIVNGSSTSIAGGPAGISLLMGLAADELKNYSTTPAIAQFYANSLTSNASNGASNYYFWQQLYFQIHVCNAVLEGLQNSTAVSASTRDQITGEAKFMRAFLLFYAVNLYGDVPIVTSTVPQVNNIIHRSPITDVYQQITDDLKEAQSKLSNNFVDGAGAVSTLRVRPNKTAATALLARAYLYQQKYDSAEAQATAVINNSNYALVGNPDSVFLANSKEAIWQLQPVGSNYNTFDGGYFILTTVPGSLAAFPVALSSNLYSAFEAGDNRLTHWVGTYTKSGTNYYYPYKYKVGLVSGSTNFTEYTMVFRLAEQYLIRAEARAQKGDIAGAQADLNMIRSRAKLPATSAATQPALLAAILHERQIELFTEWGHRWFDLIRTGNINSIMGSPGNVCQSKGGVWNTNKVLLPLPLLETQINPNLTQNPGY